MGPTGHSTAYRLYSRSYIVALLGGFLRLTVLIIIRLSYILEMIEKIASMRRQRNRQIAMITVYTVRAMNTIENYQSIPCVED